MILEYRDKMDRLWQLDVKRGNKLRSQILKQNGREIGKATLHKEGPHRSRDKFGHEALSIEDIEP